MQGCAVRKLHAMQEKVLLHSSSFFFKLCCNQGMQVLLTDIGMQVSGNMADVRAAARW